MVTDDEDTEILFVGDKFLNEVVAGGTVFGLGFLNELSELTRIFELFDAPALAGLDGFDNNGVTYFGTKRRIFLIRTGVKAVG